MDMVLHGIFVRCIISEDEIEQAIKKKVTGIGNITAEVLTTGEKPKTLLLNKIFN